VATAARKKYNETVKNNERFNEQRERQRQRERDRETERERKTDRHRDSKREGDRWRQAGREGRKEVGWKGERDCLEIAQMKRYIVQNTRKTEDTDVAERGREDETMSRDGHTSGRK